MTGGMFLLSDDMQKVSDERLNVAKKIFPLTGVTAVPLDLHSTMNKGMPSVLRLWCTEDTMGRNFLDQATIETNEMESPNNISPEKIIEEQTYEVGYSPDKIIDPYSRDRSCFAVTEGLGTWTIVSISNWMEHASKLSVPFSTVIQHSLQDFNATSAAKAASTPCELSDCGFHVFSFWSTEYTWIPHQVSQLHILNLTRRFISFFLLLFQTLLDNDPLIKRLAPHETEIFHIKPANPSRPQYIGSDLHFSCGFEVLSFQCGPKYVNLSLKNNYKKSGSVFIFIPQSGSDDSIAAQVNGKSGVVEIVARPAINNGKSESSYTGTVIKVKVQITGARTEPDGEIKISW